MLPHTARVVNDRETKGLGTFPSPNLYMLYIIYNNQYICTPEYTTTTQTYHRHPRTYSPGSMFWGMTTVSSMYKVVGHVPLQSVGLFPHLLYAVGARTGPPGCAHGGGYSVAVGNGFIAHIDPSGKVPEQPVSRARMMTSSSTVARTSPQKADCGLADWGCIALFYAGSYCGCAIQFRRPRASNGAILGWGRCIDARTFREQGRGEWHRRAVAPHNPGLHREIKWGLLEAFLSHVHASRVLTKSVRVTAAVVGTEVPAPWFVYVFVFGLDVGCENLRRKLLPRKKKEIQKEGSSQRRLWQLRLTCALS